MLAWLSLRVSLAKETSVRSSCGDIERLRLGAGKLGVEPRSIGNVGDQPVEAADIVLDDFDEASALLVGPGEWQGLDGAAQRGQRVLELVDDIGGKGLDGVDAVVERVVMSRSAPDKWPISSRRWVKSGISTRLLMPRRTRSAALASRRIGSAIVPASNTDEQDGDQRDEARR